MYSFLGEEFFIFERCIDVDDVKECIDKMDGEECQKEI